SSSTPCRRTPPARSSSANSATRSRPARWSGKTRARTLDRHHIQVSLRQWRPAMADAAPVFVNPPALAKPPGYTHVVEVPAGGRTVYVAGQVAWDAAGQLVGPNDFAAQAEQVFKNLDAALKDRGGSLASIVKWTIYVVDVGNLAALR